MQNSNITSPPSDQKADSRHPLHQRKNVYRDYRIRILSNAGSRIRLVSNSTKPTALKSRIRFKGESVDKIPENIIEFESIHKTTRRNHGGIETKPEQILSNNALQGKIWDEPIYRFANRTGIIW